MSAAHPRFHDAQGLARVLAESPPDALVALPAEDWDGLIGDVWTLLTGAPPAAGGPAGEERPAGRIRVDVEAPPGRRRRFVLRTPAGGPLTVAPAGDGATGDGAAGDGAGSDGAVEAALGLSGVDLLRLAAGTLALSEGFRAGLIRMSGEVGRARDALARLGLAVEA